jgi:hypothetical protein
MTKSIGTIVAVNEDGLHHIDENIRSLGAFVEERITSVQNLLGKAGAIATNKVVEVMDRQ